MIVDLKSGRSAPPCRPGQKCRAAVELLRFYRLLPATPTSSLGGLPGQPRAAARPTGEGRRPGARRDRAGRCGEAAVAGDSQDVTEPPSPALGAQAKAIAVELVAGYEPVLR
jgi:hypothetical protein